MRSVSEAEKYWKRLDEFRTLTDLKISVSSHTEPQITAGLRSVCWKIFLLFKTLDRSAWPKHLNDSRSAYDSLRSLYLRAIQHPDEFESSIDPLSENEESPWQALRADESLRAEIFQDVERCMPDNVYFRQPATQNMMLDILFVFCKMNPDVGYRQGMHEVLAPILWVVERDAVDAASAGHPEIDHGLTDNLDSAFIEHDTFTLYSLVMRTAKSFYATADPGSSSKDTPMLQRSSRIFDRYLPKADPELSAHLLKLEIVPQIFLLRWIRLLFGREFPLNNVFDMWDALFAIDPSLELVDMISIAMLLRIRWQLVESDTNEAFSLLLRYPEPDAPAFTFIKDALYLRDHLNPEGGAEIITRYGKQAPVIKPEPPKIREVSPAPSFTSSRTRRSIASPRSIAIPQGGGFESVIQNAAKGVIDQARNSQWSVGKAIRDAVGEVKKNVEAYQSGPVSGQTTPRAGGREYRQPGQNSILGAKKPTLERTPSSNVVKRIENLERRNKSLAKMLETTVSELWDFHKERSEDSTERKDAVDALSLAIAKVQFVQVYLEDPSLPVPDDSPETIPETPPSLLSPPIPERTLSAPPLPTTGSSSTPPSSATDNTKNQPSLLVPPLTSPSSRQPSSSRPRNLLSSSSFSWMLGQEEAPPSSTFASASAHSAFSADEKRRMRGSMGGKAFLFGDEEDAESPVREGKRGSTSSKGGGRGAPKKAESEVEEEIIDLGDMGKRGAVG